MQKKQKILIFLLLVLFVLVLYLILTSESARKIDNSGKPIKSESSVSPENGYKLKTKEFLSAYENLIKADSLAEKDIMELKNKLLDLRVPLEFKELHMRFILALNSMENYLSQKDEQGKSDSLQAFNQLKADYSWLND
ncbi:hypothetical protein HY797_02600 [Candidatus Falkowbacteria bacterium]|nr:hypothetical protein [Candidatus Falkowbacteria bacterium]